RIEPVGGRAEPERAELRYGGELPRGKFSGDQLWDGGGQSVQQLGAGQGRGSEYYDFIAQSRGSGRPGAVADGVPAGTDAAAAALHAGADPGDQRAVRSDQRPGAGDGGAGRTRLRGAVAGGGAEEVQAGGFHLGAGAATAAEPGDGGECADLGDGGVCQGPRGTAGVAVEDAGPVRDQHYRCGDGRDDGGAGDSRADGAGGPGCAQADCGGASSGNPPFLTPVSKLT